MVSRVVSRPKKRWQLELEGELAGDADGNGDARDARDARDAEAGHVGLLLAAFQGWIYYEPCIHTYIHACMHAYIRFQACR